ncbi:hypothetical protein SAMD00019534_011130 [Acytostelium subglobosum LB1]|uniref:hypothetical protein n=1 Tax=Acytostelium subglobosum LB1 TaxID=1410327 RepID=UPI0006451D00|nr:hypothetical protein SAMD00019534_011130 [Acytostelium subglobosum LB1]GAM17938.1 hypothetical protein SAMD00019534_011130 [Acytostelium subglobosum LB1]|eukprot:XP_012758534.1 hypothetical protein SAMD00019534_011130 [Acytostelium subglobosum LB1]
MSASMPPSLTWLSMSSYFDDVQSLPPGLTFLHLDHSARILPGALPHSLTHLIYVDQAYSVDRSAGTISVRPGTIPPSVTQLTIGNIVPYGDASNKAVPLLPNSITDLTFSDYCNQPLGNNGGIIIPEAVTKLSFGHCFNQRVNPHLLPSSITKLSFGFNFNQPLRFNSIPPSVTRLRFGESFNQVLHPGTLPSSSLIHLSFGFDFNCPLAVGSIPSTVRFLKFGDRFNQSISNPILQESLTNLKLGYKFDKMLDVPKSLVKLRIGRFGPYHQDPNDDSHNVKLLKRIPRDQIKTIHLDTKPSSLKHISIGMGHYQHIVSVNDQRRLNFTIVHHKPLLISLEFRSRSLSSVRYPP